MDLLDFFALLGRRYEPRRTADSGSLRFSLTELLETFDRQAVIELTTYKLGKPAVTLRPDAARKLKVSLLDGVSEMSPARDGWFEVQQTPPTGDLSKVKITAHAPDGTVIGEIRMMIGRRSFEHYFSEDPGLRELIAKGQ